MPPVSAETLKPAALTVGVILALLAAQPVAAIQTAVDGPDEVTKHDDIELVVTVKADDQPESAIENYTLEITPVGDDESLVIVFDGDGTILAVSPPRGVVGEGNIRVNHLRRELAITPIDTDDGAGYGYGYGYGYGSGGETIVTFRIVLTSTAFKHGHYDVRASVNTAEEMNVGGSATHRFTILVPAGHLPPQGDETGDDDEPDNEDDDGDDTDKSDSEDAEASEDDHVADDDHESEQAKDGDHADADDEDEDDRDEEGRSKGHGNGPPDHARDDENGHDRGSMVGPTAIGGW